MAMVINFPNRESKDAYFEYNKKQKILTLRFYGSTQTFTTDMSYLNNTIYTIKFKDTTWTDMRDHIAISAFGTDKNDRIVGNGVWRDYIDAGDGNDVITGTGTLIGGKGNDTINAKVTGSSDIVFFFKGDGHDVINALDTSSTPATDTLYLKDISSKDTRWSRKGNNLVFDFIYTDGTAADSVTLANFFAGEKYQTFHNIVFEKDGVQFLDLRKNFTFTQYADKKGSKLIGTPWKNEIYGDSGNDIITTAGLENYIDAGAGNNIITSTGVKNTIYTGAGNDIITSTGAENYVDAGEGNDRINSAGTIIGGKGDDTITLNIAGRSSLLFFDVGHGKDVINSFDKLMVDDTLRFGPGITINDLSYERKGNNLIIYVKGRDSGDQITINNYFKGPQYQTIHTFEFTNGDLNTIIDKISDIRDPSQYTFNIVGSQNNDIIVATPWANNIAAGAGNDKITGAGTIAGGQGDDIINLNVAGSKDTIIFNSLDGKDVINSFDKLMAEDTLRFGPTITKNDLTYERKGNNLIIYVKGRESGDQITVNNYFKGPQYQTIHKFEFTDTNGKVIANQTINDVINSNYVFTIQGIDAKSNTMQGTQFLGKDNLIGGDRNDKITGSGSITGGKGDDVITITTNGSADVIYFQLGDGKDVITSLDKAPEGQKGKDTIILGNQISKNMVNLVKQANNLLIKIGDNDQIKVNNYFKGADYQTIKTIKLSQTGETVTLNPNLISTIPSTLMASLATQTNYLLDALASFAPTTSSSSLMDNKLFDTDTFLIAPSS